MRIFSSFIWLVIEGLKLLRFLYLPSFYREVSFPAWISIYQIKKSVLIYWFIHTFSIDERNDESFSRLKVVLLTTGFQHTIDECFLKIGFWFVRKTFQRRANWIFFITIRKIIIKIDLGMFGLWSKLLALVLYLACALPKIA